MQKWLFYITFAGSIINVLLLSIACYYYNGSWAVEVLSFLVPLFICINFLFLFLLARIKLLFSIVPAIGLLLSLKPIGESASFSLKEDKGESDFRVMSYNIGLFNPQRMTDKKSYTYRNLTKYEWLRSHREPDILCIQEFYHSDKKTGAEALDSIKAAGNYNYYYLNPHYERSHGGFFGVVTFSKFPAIQSGELKFGRSFINKGTWHDFAIKGDTIRVLNCHLQSMSIRLEYDESKNLLINARSLTKSIYSKLNFGFNKRKGELQILEDFIDNSPYKIVLSIDLNALPYSFAYQRLKKRFGNAFEEAGFGFGFTYRFFPWFIRIDNQFYDKRLKVDYYKTHRELKISDHYAIEAGYSLGK
jgi:endonuclease/exonuclease/phosphatase family metal-dependent hydrolase